MSVVIMPELICTEKLDFFFLISVYKYVHTFLIGCHFFFNGNSRFVDFILDISSMTDVFAFLLSPCKVLTTSCNHYYLYHCSVS